MLKIYLAGPDVFRRDYETHKARLKAMCKTAGIVALCPADDELVEIPGDALSLCIFKQNIALLDRADVVMANLQNFRGNEPDSGTVFEVGYAIGRGKKVWCYNAPVGDLIDQVAHDACGRDRDDYLVEDFGHGRNLMLMHACHHVAGDAASCIEAIRCWHEECCIAV